MNKKQEKIEAVATVVPEKFELSVLADLAKNTAVAPVADTRINKFLPYVFISSEDFDGTPYHLYIKSEQEIKLTKPWMLLSVSHKRASRTLVGKRYDERCYEGGKTDEEFKEKEIEAEENDRVQIGFSHLIFIYSEEFKGFATLETFNSQESYWVGPLSKCHVSSGNTVRVDQIDHSENLTVSKKSNNSYLSSYKFKKWAVVPLTKEVKEEVNKQFAEKKEAIREFSER